MWTSTWALNTLVAKGKATDWMVHMLGQSIGGFTDATHGMTLSAISLAYYRYIMPNGLAKFKRFAINVWHVDPQRKTDREIAEAGLAAMEAYMREIGVVMNLSDLGVEVAMIPGIIQRTPILTGGYKALTPSDLEVILTQSLHS